MKSFNESGLGDIQRVNQAPTKDTIVRCPSCQTRYAVASTVISEFDTPKFHCARCDQVFNLTEAEATPIEETSDTVGTGQHQRISVEFEKSPGEAAFKKVEPETVSYREPESWQRRASVSSRALEIPGRLDNTSRAEPPHEHASGEEHGEVWTVNTETQMSLAFNGEERKPRVSHAFSLKDMPGRSAAEPSLPGAFALGDTNSPTLTDIRMPPGGGSAPPSGADTPKPRGALSAWATLFIPSLALLALLMCLGYYLGWDNETATRLTAAVSPSSPQIPPAGLVITDPAFQQLTLDNGDRVFLVSGTLSNRSEEVFDDVIIEGFTFNKSGRVLLSTRASMRSNLAKTRIKSLTVDMIKNLQGAEAIEAYTLKAGQKQDFTFAILPDDDSQASRDRLSSSRFFGARIYSVRTK